MSQRILFRKFEILSESSYNHRSNCISLLSGYPEPAATQIRTRGLSTARDGYKLPKKNKHRDAPYCIIWIFDWLIDWLIDLLITMIFALKFFYFPSFRLDVFDDDDLTTTTTWQCRLDDDDDDDDRDAILFVSAFIVYTLFSL